MRVKQLIRLYDELETPFIIVDRCNQFSKLVTANGNNLVPIQRWFRMKESFSIDLLENVLNYWGIQPESIHSILDPFCGTGTTLLSVQKIAKKYNIKNLHVYGIEANPFFHFVSKTKCNWNLYDITAIKDASQSVLKEKHNGYKIPMLTTLNRKEVYEPALLKKILSLKSGIDTLPEKIREPLLLGYANILEPISGVRKDGRGLRIVENKQRPKLLDALTNSWNNITEDLSIANNYYKKVKTTIILGDGRTFSEKKIIKNNSIDIVFYSPPYLNNIDYTEVYKIELWMLGYINSYIEFKEQRLKTFRSHPSVSFHTNFSIYNDERMSKFVKILDELVDTLPRNEDLWWRSNMFKGYFDDIYRTLKNQSLAIKPGGWIFCTVGNSLHGSVDKDGYRVPVATDLLVALIAQSIGLEVKSIMIARYLNRRNVDNYYLRESIIVLQKRK